MAWSAPRTWVPGEMVTAALLNTEIRDNEAYLVGDTAWTAVTFMNAWVNYGAPFANAAYRKVGDVVYLRGVIKSGTINTQAFVLPAAYRPTVDQLFICVSNNLIGRLTIRASDGFVVPATPISNVFATLDGVCFSVA